MAKKRKQTTRKRATKKKTTKRKTAKKTKRKSKTKTKRSKTKTDPLLWAVLILTFLGIFLSAYLTYGHYTSTSEFCLGEKGGEALCDVVNQSIYAEIFGFPIAGLGLLGYAGMFFLAFLLVFPQKNRHLKKLTKLADPLLLTFVFFSIAMKLYFNYLQFFVLKTICVLCETSAAIIVILLIILLIRAKRTKLTKEKKNIAIFLFLVLATFMSLFVILSNHHAFNRDTDFDVTAQCLTEKNVEFFGTFWCPSCGKVKKTLGSAFQYIQYVECDPKGENSQTQRCLDLEIDKYPTWIDDQGKRLNAQKDMFKVAEFFDCPVGGGE